MSRKKTTQAPKPKRQTYGFQAVLLPSRSRSGASRVSASGGGTARTNPPFPDWEDPMSQLTWPGWRA